MEQLITIEFYLGNCEKQLLPLELFGDEYNYQSAYWTLEVAIIKAHSTTWRVKVSWRLFCSLSFCVPSGFLVKHPFLPKTFLSQANHLDNCIFILKDTLCLADVVAFRVWFFFFAIVELFVINCFCKEAL